ncbi:MAG: hypothetical protein P8Z31_00655, partial [Gammaproteobacteria bacterium]
LSLRDGNLPLSLRDDLILQSGGCAADMLFTLLAQRKEGKRKGTLRSPDRCASRLWLLQPCRTVGCGEQGKPHLLKDNRYRCGS